MADFLGLTPFEQGVAVGVTGTLGLGVLIFLIRSIVTSKARALKQKQERVQTEYRNLP